MFLLIKTTITISGVMPLFSWQKSIVKRMVNIQMQGGYIQTQGYIVKRKESMAKRKKTPAFDH